MLLSRRRVRRGGRGRRRRGRARRGPRPATRTSSARRAAGRPGGTTGSTSPRRSPGSRRPRRRARVQPRPAADTAGAVAKRARGSSTKPASGVRSAAPRRGLPVPGTTALTARAAYHADVWTCRPTSETRPALRVMVADDAVLFREGLARLLIEAGFAVTAGRGRAGAARACGRTRRTSRGRHPDAADPHHRGPGRGPHAAREAPAVGVLVLSAHVEPSTRCSSSSPAPTGAGYLLKERVADLDELTDAVRRVARAGW